MTEAIKFNVGDKEIVIGVGDTMEEQFLSVFPEAGEENKDNKKEKEKPWNK